MCVVYTMLHVCLDMTVTRNDIDRPVAMKIFQFDVHLCPLGIEGKGLCPHAT